MRSEIAQLGNRKRRETKEIEIVISRWVKPILFFSIFPSSPIFFNIAQIGKNGDHRKNRDRAGNPSIQNFSISGTAWASPFKSSYLKQRCWIFRHKFSGPDASRQHTQNPEKTKPQDHQKSCPQWTIALLLPANQQPLLHWKLTWIHQFFEIMSLRNKYLRSLGHNKYSITSLSGPLMLTVMC